MRVPKVENSLSDNANCVFGCGVLPDVGLAPTGVWSPPPPPPSALGPHPPSPVWAASRSLAKRAKGGGGRGKERAGREGVWLEGRVLQLQWGMGGGPSKHQLGPDPHLGAPKAVSPSAKQRLHETPSHF